MMDGEELYEIFRKEHAELGWPAPPWTALDVHKRAIWDRIALRVTEELI
jgi:hypothetical protein